MLNAYKMRTMRTHSRNVSEGFTIRDAPKSITGLVTSRIAILGAAFRSVDGDLVSVIMVFVFGGDGGVTRTMRARGSDSDAL